jgi:hypothetical protein
MNFTHTPLFILYILLHQQFCILMEASIGARSMETYTPTKEGTVSVFLSLV